MSARGRTETSKLPDLPAGWIWARPTELCSGEEYSLGIGPFGSNLKVSDYRDSGMPLVFVRNIRSQTFAGSHERFVSVEKGEELRPHWVAPGDLLVTKMGDPPGDVCLYPETRPVGIVTADCIKFRLSSLLPVPAYFVYALRTELVRAQILEATSGVAQQKISLEKFKSILIPVAPPEQQARIVAEIEKQFTELDAGVAALKRVQANLKRYRASVLKAACEGRLVPTEAELARAEGRDYEPADKLLERILKEHPARWETNQLTDIGGLTSLPMGWAWTTLGCMLMGIQAGKSFKCLERPPQRGEVGVVKVSAVTWGRFDEEESKTCTSEERIDPDLYVRDGDFLFSRANTIELVGACVIAGHVDRKLMLSDKILRFRFAPAVEPRWMLYVLRSQHGRSEIERLATGNQESMRNIGQDRIRQIRAPLPPLAEQGRIVAEVENRLSVVEQIETVVELELKRADRLRQSILKRAFEGRLVPQDPNDEPAEVLLERIRQARVPEEMEVGADPKQMSLKLEGKKRVTTRRRSATP